MAKGLSRSFTLLFLVIQLSCLVLGTGTQFITGPCTSDADCASGCCGFNSGLCAGPVIAQTRDGGCGHGDAQPNANAANALTGGGSSMPSTSAAAAAPASTSSSSGGSGKAPGTQFITGPCASDSDCADGCCGFNTGLCAGPVIAQERDGGCGHGDAQPNANAANALTGGGGGSSAASTSAAAVAAASTSTSSSGGSGKAPGTQFITGPCASDSDCADGCCGFNTGLCAGPVVAQERDGGCGHGDAQPNANAANALTGGTAAKRDLHFILAGNKGKSRRGYKA